MLKVGKAVVLAQASRHVQVNEMSGLDKHQRKGFLT